MALIVLRTVFLIVAAGIGVALVPQSMDQPWKAWASFGVVFGTALAAIGLDVAVRRKQLDVISAVYFGTVVGLFLTFVVNLALEALQLPASLRGSVSLVVGMVMCYACISLLIQTKNDFRFVIPYVEFSREVKGPKPYLLDTSVVIDGRIADLVGTHLFDGSLLMPRFALAELQQVADSSDRMKRARGRRGLEVLEKLRADDNVEFQINEVELPEFVGQPVDLKLVMLAKHLEGRIVTHDYNLNKVAKLHGVEVINLNDIANALKPMFLPGESLTVRVVKPGEEANQGVGYLDDGTMVVVEGGRERVNQLVPIVVTSVLQKSAGRMIFGRYEPTPS